MKDYVIREALSSEHLNLGEIMVDVYAKLSGFPKPDVMPDYYDMLSDIGSQTQKPETQLLVAVSSENELLGGVVYIGDMAFYGASGKAKEVKNASGIRLLAVAPNARGLGIGKALTMACIDKALEKQQKQVVLHTTSSMKIAWGLYERLGFYRSPDLDFNRKGMLEVFGFRLDLKN